MKILVTGALIACLGMASGCRGKPPAEAGPKKARACNTSDDCETGWVCLANACADMRSKAIYTDTANAVTPDKVKRELEQKLRAHEKKLDNLPTQ